MADSADIQNLLNMTGEPSSTNLSNRPLPNPPQEVPKNKMSRTTIILLVVLAIALIIAATLAWRTRQAQPDNGMHNMIEQCPDPERRQDLKECNSLLGQCKRPWVKDLLTRAIELQATPNGGGGGGGGGGPSTQTANKSDKPSGAVIHGGGDDDPLFD